MSKVNTLVKRRDAAVAKLADIKKRINESITNVAMYMDRLVNDLYLVKKEKLYLFDKCNSLREFFDRNGYAELMDKSFLTIQNKLYIVEYADKIGMTDIERRMVPEQKLRLFRTQGVDDKKKVIKMSKSMNYDELYEHFNPNHPIKGDFYNRKTYDSRKLKLRPGHTARRVWVEFPEKDVGKVERTFAKLCIDNDWRIL